MYYTNNQGLGAKRYLPFGDLNQGTPILTLVNLDRLNNQNDPQPDGVFDYVEGYTVLSQYSRVIFPLLQPFGRDLAPKVFSNPALRSRQFVLSLIRFNKSNCPATISKS